MKFLALFIGFLYMARAFKKRATDQENKEEKVHTGEGTDIPDKKTGPIN